MGGGGGGKRETQGRWAKRFPKEWAKLLGDETTRGETTQGEQGIGRNDPLPVQIPNATGTSSSSKSIITVAERVARTDLNYPFFMYSICDTVYSSEA